MAIDTSEARGSVAVLGEGGVRAVEAHTDRSDYSEWLIAAVDRVLSMAGVARGGVDLYAVATGPGSFTGVRVGLTTVKAWCEVYGKPVVGVSRLEALARSRKPRTGIVVAYYDAQRGQVFAALYRSGPDGLVRIGDEMVIAPADLLEIAGKEAGNGPIHWVTLDPEVVSAQERWAERTKRGDEIEQCSAELAGEIGRVGAERAGRGEYSDPLELDANYVRRSDAEIFWKGPAAHVR